MLDKRTMQLLQVLVQAHHYVSIKDLMERFSISRRTLYYDISKINDWLKESGLPQVQYIYAKGFYLAEESKEAVTRLTGTKTGHYVMRSRDRQTCLLLYLLLSNRRLTTQDGMAMTGVSRNTILHDVSLLKQALKQQGVTLSFSQSAGYAVAGDERVIRHILGQHVQALLHDGQEHLLRDVYAECAAASLDDILAWLAQTEEELQLRFAEESAKQIVYLIAFSLQRFQLGHPVKFPAERRAHLRVTRHYRELDALERKLALLLPEEEKCYLATLLLSAKVQELDPAEARQEFPEMKLAISRMVDLFEQRACVVFDQRPQLEQNLYIHLQPAYYRLMYNMEAANPLKESIQQQYPDLFELTKKSIGPLEELVGKPIHEDEVAFIALHFGGWMRRQGITATPRKRVLLICANGVGTSRILVQQLEGLFPHMELLGPITLRQYPQFREEVDLVISTAKVPEPRHRIHLVNPILSDSDKIQLLKEMETLPSTPAHVTAQTIVEIVKKYAAVEKEEQLLEEIKQTLQQHKQWKRERKPMLKELLGEEFIQLAERVSDWKEAIRLASTPLLNSQAITPEYVDAMIVNVEENGPYIVIAPRVAFPHARPEQGVNRLGMSLLRLKQPVAFAEPGTRDAQLIIVLAAVDNETHLKALSQMSMMLSDESNIDRLIAADNKETILQCIADHSNM